MNEYYTYAYLREDGTPYYIGKGKGRRISKPHPGQTVPPPYRRIYLETGLSEEEAFAHEKYMIATTPNLRNYTEGGEGSSGYRWTEEQKDKIRGRNPWNKGSSHSVNYQAKYMREWREGKKRKQSIVREFVSPEGVRHSVTNMKQFCKEHNLCYQHMINLHLGRLNQHKGWRR